MIAADAGAASPLVALCWVLALVGCWMLGSYGGGMLLLISHELVHGAATALLRGRVLAGTIGSGPRLARWSLFGAEWELRAFPTHGLVHVAVPAARWFRTRLVLVHLSAPLSGVAALAVLITPLVSAGEPRNPLLLPWGVEGLISLLWLAALMALLVAGIATLASLLPFDVPVGGELMRSDARNALAIARLPREHVPAAVTVHVRLVVHADAWRDLRQGTPERALAELRARRGEALGEVQVLLPLLYWAAEGEAAALAAAAEERRRLDELAGAWRAAGGPGYAQAKRTLAWSRAVLDLNEAFLVVQTLRPELLPEAEKLVRRAATEPALSWAARRTRALIALHAGRVDEGLAALRRVWRHGETRWEDGACACYLAYGHALQGRAARAGWFLRKAERLHRGGRLLQRYRDLVAAALHDAGEPDRAGYAGR